MGENIHAQLLMLQTTGFHICKQKTIDNCTWNLSLKFIEVRIYIQYTYIVGKYKIYMYELFRPVLQRVQMNFIFNDNVRILCLSCNVKKVGKLVRFKQKGQKQASFLAFHKCCQVCLLRGPRYISISFIVVCALRCT